MAVVATAVLLAGCGPGSGPDEGLPPPTSAAPAPAAAVAVPDAASLFNWAENHYGQFFPIRQSDQQAGPYTYRHYPQTGNYVGVAGTGVYILGPMAGGGPDPLYLGELADFACRVLDQQGCTERTDRFSLPPGDAAAEVSQSARFHAELSNPAARYQWQVSRDGGNSFTDVAGATSPVYDTPPTRPEDDGLLYRVAADSVNQRFVSTAVRLIVRQRATEIIGIAAGEQHACALSSSGRVACWGNNSSGQLGDGTRTLRRTATVVSGLSDAVGVVTGDAHTCALRANGTLVCWGLNLSGQLGLGDQNDRLTPTEVPGLQGVTQMSAFGVGTCAQTAAGKTWCWGAAAGHGAAGTTLRPTEVPALTGMRGPVVGDGQLRCTALASAQVACWGTGPDNQVRPSVTVVDGAPLAVHVAAGIQHVCALSLPGGVHCWGANELGQLGDGTLTPRAAPTATPDLTGAMQVMARRHAGCAILRDGRLMCWGDNQGGLLWPTTPTRAPRMVAEGTFPGLVQMGGAFICRRFTDRRTTVQCWGSNAFGELGNGGTPASPGSGPVLGLAEL